MDSEAPLSMTRRAFAASTAFMIVPRHVLAGPGQTAPSDRLNIATIGLGRQGMAVTMELLARPEIQVVAVCDPNQGSKNYVEYGQNDLLKTARRLLGSGYENWGEDLTSPGSRNLTHHFNTSLGMGGRDPARRVVEAYYGSENYVRLLQRLRGIPRLPRASGKRKRTSTPSTSPRRTTGMRRSPWLPCENGNTCSARSR